MLSTEKNNINNLLNDDAFIAWVTSGKKTNNTYWEGLKVGLSDSDKNAFNKAVTILTKLRTLHIDDDKSVKSQDFIKKQYNNLMADYNASENKNSKVFKLNNWLKYAAVLVVSISIIGFVFLFNTPSNTFEANLAQTDFNTSDLLIQTSDKKYYKISSDEDIKWLNENGVLVTVNDESISFTASNASSTEKNSEYKLFVPKGKKYLLNLIDGTSVELNSNTNISFVNSLSTKQRKVSLKGEAFFDVAHNENRPFIVQSTDLKIEVLGTEFNVSNYESNKYASTTLIDGSINVSNSQGESKILKPGNQAILYHNQERIIVEKANIQKEVSWTRNRMIFENETLENFIQKLETWYGVEFIMNDENIRQYRFTGTLKKENDLAHFLQMLKYTRGIDYSINGKSVSLFFE